MPKLLPQGKVTTPKGVDPEAHPWSEWPRELCERLWAAGLSSATEIANLSDTYFVKHVPGIGERTIPLIREIVPRTVQTPMTLRRYQPNGGWLRTKGEKGNRGAASAGGMMPSVIRANARSAFYELIPELIDISLGKGIIRMFGVCEACGHEHPVKLHRNEVLEAQVPYRDRVSAANVLGKYGVGPMKGVPKDDLVEYLKVLGAEMQDALRDEMGDEEGGALAERIFERWKRASRERLA